MNVIEDTLNHISLVRRNLLIVINEIGRRALHHDESKFQSPEKEMYEIWRPKLDLMSIESDEYKNSLAQMGEGLKHHYAANRHHPEHFENGLDGMNLVDIIEMVCDWVAASERKNEPVNMKWASERFGISENEHLYHIIKMTIEMLELQDIETQ